MNMYRFDSIVIIAALAAALSGCSGSGGAAPVSSPTASTPPSTSIPTDQQRAQAATQTATNNAACTAIQPFYWEIGDRSAALTGGTAGGASPAATTPLLIASASKWFFGAYVVQVRNGNLGANDLAALTMRAGYTNLKYSTCTKRVPAAQNAETVHECLVAAHLGGGSNADYDGTAAGKFFYNGGHFQWLADTGLGLGAANNAALQSAIAAVVGMDLSFTYDSPQLAAGIQTSGQDYGLFLRKILGNQLRMHDALGTNAVCASPAACPGQAISSPIPASETWHYSLGHWVEDDPAVGDGAYSSPGAFGFYPWIDASKTYYGILARYSQPSLLGDTVAFDSVNCGRRIRKAWLTGTAQ